MSRAIIARVGLRPAGLPLYQTLRDALAAQIESGRLAPGEQLMSERQLCEQFEVSRVTARRALIALEHDGMITAEPGRGWFVRDGSLSEPPNTLLSFTDLARARGLVATAQVLTRTVRPASIDEAEALAVVPGTDLFVLERVRLLDGMPVAFDHCQVALARCPALVDIDFTTESLYAALRNRGRVVPVTADCTLEAVNAGLRFAALLGLDPASPVLRSRQVAVDREGVPVEASEIVYRGDRYRFRTTLHAGGPRS